MVPYGCWSLWARELLGFSPASQFVSFHFAGGFVMATATQRSQKASRGAAKRWKLGTDHYLSKFKKTADEIHKRAKEMRDTDEDAEAIVEMAIEKTREFAEQYHSEESDD
jgi:hypothetical protein